MAGVAYNSGFERNRIRELAQWFDDLAPALGVTVGRTAQSVHALMEKPGQTLPVRHACRQALQAHGQREMVVVRRLLEVMERAGD